MCPIASWLHRSITAKQTTRQSQMLLVVIGIFRFGQKSRLRHPKCFAPLRGCLSNKCPKTKLVFHAKKKEQKLKLYKNGEDCRVKTAVVVCVNLLREKVAWDGPCRSPWGPCEALQCTCSPSQETCGNPTRDSMMVMVMLLRLGDGDDAETGWWWCCWDWMMVMMLRLDDGDGDDAETGWWWWWWDWVMVMVMMLRLDDGDGDDAETEWWWWCWDWMMVMLLHPFVVFLCALNKWGMQTWVNSEPLKKQPSLAVHCALCLWTKEPSQ